MSSVNNQNTKKANINRKKNVLVKPVLPGWVSKELTVKLNKLGFSPISLN